MPFLPWAWTSFPVEPENGIAGLAIRGRIGRIRDTVCQLAGYCTFLILPGRVLKIRALNDPGSPVFLIRTSQFRKKPSQFLINNPVFHRIYDGETGIPDKRI
jgi:hypothetical protein